MKEKKTGLVFEQLMMGITGAQPFSIATAEPKQPDGFLEGKFWMKITHGKQGVKVFFYFYYLDIGCEVKHPHSQICARFVPTAALFYCCFVFVFFFIHVVFRMPP